MVKSIGTLGIVDHTVFIEEGGGLKSLQTKFFPARLI